MSQAPERVIRLRFGVTAGERRRIANEIRPKVRSACELSSINKVAARIGLHSSALKYFLRGGTPYVHTLTRLVDWYNGRARDVTLADLLGMLPAAARPGAPALLIDAIRQACADVGERLPPGVLAALAAAASPPTHAPAEGAAP